MSVNLPTALAGEAAEPDAASPPVWGSWVKTALTILFAAAAVLLVSFISVVTNL